MDEAEALSATVDLWMEWDGASMQAWVIFQSTEDEGGVAGADNDQFGFGIQGAIHLVPDEWEVFGRWEFIDYDDFASAGGDEDNNFFTFGVTNYIHGHAVKWTNQVTFVTDEVADGSSSLALVTDGAGEDGQVGFISQLQLLF